VRAKARQANLELAVVAARQGLARAYLGHRDWRRARHEALQAHDMSYRLRCPYEIFRAAASLGEALTGLGQAERAGQHIREARDMVRRLAGTLPQHYAQIFLDRPYVQVVCDRAAEYSVDEDV
jgi:hypothetical protein